MPHHSRRGSLGVRLNEERRGRRLELWAKFLGQGRGRGATEVRRDQYRVF